MTTSCMASLFLTGYFWGHSLWVKPCEPPSRCLQDTSSIHHFSMALSMRCVPPCLIKTRHSWRSLLVLAKWRWSQKRPAVAKRDTYRHIDSRCFRFFEFLYLSDRLNVTLKSSASLKVAMIVSEPADIWNQIFVSKTSQQKSNCMRLLRMKQWFSIWASRRRQISNLAMFFFCRPLLSERTFFFKTWGRFET